MSYPERIVPDETEPGVVALHLKRYEFALPFCEGRDVLDAACGVAYGTALLAERARWVVGVDVSEEALAYARMRYARPNVELLRGDLLEVELGEGAFDVACSFETIEHLRDPAAFLGRVARALRPHGILLVSTPHVARTSHAPANPFHHVELSRTDFEGLLRECFEEIEVYGQRRLQTTRHRAMQRLDVLGLRRRLTFLRRAWRLLGTRPVAELTAEDVVISQEEIERASELVAVCRRPRR